MIQTQYINASHFNYERLSVLREDLGKYQYCMLTRGGIKGILPCNQRSIDGTDYLYYDITGKQNLEQMFERDVIDRNWIGDFFAALEGMKETLYRFLLDEKSLCFFPSKIYQELDRNRFFFLYVPYYDGEQNRDFMHLVNFILEHANYDDSELVEFIYHMYEQYEKHGTVYLQQQIFTDVKNLLKKKRNKIAVPVQVISGLPPKEPEEQMQEPKKEPQPVEQPIVPLQSRDERPDEKKSRKSLFDLRKRREKEDEERNKLENHLLARMENLPLEEEYEVPREIGNTTLLGYNDTSVRKHFLMDGEGKLTVEMHLAVYIIGKMQEKTDIYLEDPAVSRLHCKLIRTDTGYMLEDMNSKNGTYVNGQRLNPYERRELRPGDQITCGMTNLYYR